MSNDRENNSKQSLATERRKIIKRTIQGGAMAGAATLLPAKWTRPVVASVLLPAHAQASTTVYAADLSTLVLVVTRGDGETMRVDNGGALLAALVPDASAQAVPSPTDYLCITVYGGMFDARFAREYSVNNINEYAASGGTLGNATPLGLTGESCGNAILPTLTVTNPTASGVNFLLDFGGGQVQGLLPLGDCAIVPVGICNIPSDRAIKENFVPIDNEAILARVADMPLSYWNYTEDAGKTRHIGPMAQDFMAAFAVGDSDRHIQLVDANGVTLAAIQALNARLEEKDRRIAALEQQLEKITRRLDG